MKKELKSFSYAFFLSFFYPLRLKIWITLDGKKDHFSVGKSSIEYTRIAEDPYDGVMKLWEYTQKSDRIHQELYYMFSNQPEVMITLHTTL